MNTDPDSSAKLTYQFSSRASHSCTVSAYRSFAAVILLGAGVSVLLVAALNFVVDPQRIHDWPVSSWLNPYKDLGDQRVFMAEDVLRNPHQTVLLGSSRVGAAIDPMLGVWKDQAYNFNLRGAAFAEIDAAARYLIQHTSTDTVYLFLDFFMFNDLLSTRGDFARSRLNSELSTLDFQLTHLVSWPTLEASWETLAHALQGRRFVARERGYQRPEQSAVTADTRTRFRQSLLYYYLSPNMYAEYQSFAANVRKLTDLVRFSRQNEVKLILVVLPVHALQLETLYTLGLGPLLENWHSELTRTLTAEAEESGAQAFDMWAFTGFYYPTTAELPAPGKRIPWFADSAHVSPRFGNLLSARLHGVETGLTDSGTENFPTTPGVKLNAAELPSFIRGLNEDRDRYRWQRPNDLGWLQHLLGSASEKSRTDQP